MYKLLIVDDQSQQLKKYEQLFRYDFECFTAENGESALEIFNKETLDIILCDVKMPGGMSGFELCQQVKAVSPQTIVILTSSYSNTAYRIRGYEARADEYLNKMTSNQEVYLKVRNLLFTKKNIPASFREVEQIPATSINNFENDVRKHITEFYETPVDRRPTNKLDLDSLASALHRSSRSLQRDFARETGSTFSEFHTAVRVKLASRLLTQTDLSIKEVSEQLNFASPSTFSKSFRAFYDLTPSKYRHNARDDD